MYKFPKFIIGIEIFMFRTVSSGVQHCTHSNGISHTGYADCLLVSIQHNLYDIYLLLCVQCQTPNDGQRNVRNMQSSIPKINLRNSASIWFYYKTISRCTVLCMSKKTGTYSDPADRACIFNLCVKRHPHNISGLYLQRRLSLKYTIIYYS